MGNPTQDEFRQLRRKFDGSDPIMRGMSTAGAPSASNAARLARIYDTDPWAFDDKQVRLVLLRAFPNINTDRETPTQRRRARLWNLVITDYFKRVLPAAFIAMKLHVKEKRIEDTIRRIRKVAAGLTTDGKPRTGTRGRPSKVKKTDPPTNSAFG